MSEYQYVHFMALDRPLDDRQLEFMRRQSSRAEVTRWDFSNQEDLYDVGTMLPEIAPVRELLIGGDLRPLYVAWLACNGDDEALEPPVPAGLGKLTPALKALAKFYEVSLDLIAAARGVRAAVAPSDRCRCGVARVDCQAVAGGAAATRAAALGNRRGRQPGGNPVADPRRDGCGGMAHGRADADLGSITHSRGCRGRPAAPAGATG